MKGPGGRKYPSGVQGKSPGRAFRKSGGEVPQKLKLFVYKSVNFFALCKTK